MEERHQYQCGGRGDDYWGDRRQEREEGYLASAVASNQMSAVDDEKGKFSFAINCFSLASHSKDGLPEFPPSF